MGRRTTHNRLSKDRAGSIPAPTTIEMAAIVLVI